MKNTHTESTKIDQASKAAIEKADYYAKVAKTATENADKDAQVAEVAIAKADYYAEISKTATENADKDARAAEIAIANANETAQVAKRDGDAVAIAKADYYAEIAKDAIVKADASAEIAKSAIANAKETAQVAKSAAEDANESAQVAKSAVEAANETAQFAKNAVEDANESAKTLEDSDTTYRLDEVTSISDKGNNYNYLGKDTGKGTNFTDVFISDDIDDILIVQPTKGTQYIDEPHTNGFLGDATLEKVPTTLATDFELPPVKFCGNSYLNGPLFGSDKLIETAKTPEDSGTTYRLDEVTSTSDKGNNYNYFGKDTGKGINLTDVFISNDIDGILIVQYTEEAQYIGEPHANGLLENATLEKVSAILTTDLELAPVQFFESAPDAKFCCGNSYMDMDMNVQDLTIL